MRSRLLKFGLIGAVVLIFLLSLWLFFRSGSNQPNPAPKQLSSQEQQQITSMVSTFIELYNSYSAGNYDNIRALYDSQNPIMQTKIDAYINELEQSTKPGFSRDTRVVADSLNYQIVDEKQLTVTMQAYVTEFNGPEKTVYKIKASLGLVKDYDAWSVNSITLERQ